MSTKHVTLKAPNVNINEEEVNNLVREYEIQKDAYNNPRFLNFNLKTDHIMIVYPALKKFMQLVDGKIIRLDNTRLKEDAALESAKSMPVICTGQITYKKQNYNKTQDGKIVIEETNEPFVSVYDNIMLSNRAEFVSRFYYKNVLIGIYHVNDVIAVVDKTKDEHITLSVIHKKPDVIPTGEGISGQKPNDNIQE